MIFWIYIILGLFLLAFLLAKEVRRANRRWLVGRVIATVLAAAALVGLGFDRASEKQVRITAGVRDTAARQGITSVDWQRKLLEGERLEVHGRWTGPKAKLVLRGMGTVLDSVSASGDFVLGVVPAQRGRAVYTLAAIASGDTLERENIPLEVVPGRSLRVLLLAASPDFENTFLSNFLSGQGDAVASRTTVSKDKYQTGFANMPERSLETLTPALLADFDLVIADEGVLSPAVYRQVRERGLGLYVKVDSGAIYRPGMRTLARDSAGRPAVGIVMEGAGKIVYSTANASYAEWMAGKRQEYAVYWTMILRQLARTADTAAEWTWRPTLPRVDRPVQVTVATAVEMPSGLLGEDVVYLAQDAALPFCWQGTWWPEQEGWLAARTPGGDTTWGYVWPTDAWKGIYPKETITTSRVAVSQAMAGTGWMYWTFLICVFFLWIERKMSGAKG